MGSGLPTKPIELSDPLFYFLHGKSLIKSTKRRGLQYEWSMENIGNNPNITCSFASLHFIQLNSSKLLHLVKKSKDFIHLRQNWWTIAWFPDFRIEIIQLVASFLISHFQLILMFVVDWKFINRQTLRFFARNQKNNIHFLGYCHLFAYEYWHQLQSIRIHEASQVANSCILMNFELRCWQSKNCWMIKVLISSPKNNQIFRYFFSCAMSIGLTWARHGRHRLEATKTIDDNFFSTIVSHNFSQAHFSFRFLFLSLSFALVNVLVNL